MSINTVRRSETRVSASARPSVDLMNNTQVPPILNLDVKLLLLQPRVTKRRYDLMRYYPLSMKHMPNPS